MSTHAFEMFKLETIQVTHLTLIDARMELNGHDEEGIPVTIIMYVPFAAFGELLGAAVLVQGHETAENVAGMLDRHVDVP